MRASSDSKGRLPLLPSSLPTSEERHLSNVASASFQSVGHALPSSSSRRVEISRRWATIARALQSGAHVRCIAAEAKSSPAGNKS